MKKILSLILATLMVLTAVAALAAPSKTAADMAFVIRTVCEHGEGVVIRIIDPTELSDKIIADAVTAEKAADLFDDATKAALGEDAYELNELWPIDVFGYEVGVHGTVKAYFQFPTAYTAEQPLTVVLGHFNGEELTGNTVLEAKLADDGSVEVIFPESAIVKMLEDGLTMMYVLNK